jgi:hypothetical protein
VFVDDQEMTDEAAREPVPLSPGVEHSIAIKLGNKVLEQFGVEVQPGEEVRRPIASSASGAAASAPDPTSASGRPEPVRPKPDRLRKSSSAEDKARSSATRGTSSSGKASSSPNVSKASADRSSAGAGKPAAQPGEPGSFTAFTKPWARVYIDGKDSGKMTPIVPRSAISLAPGTHKVTFVVGDQKFHYDIVIEPGKRKNLVKVLPVK